MKKNRPSPKQRRNNQVGSLGEKLLAAGLIATSDVRAETNPTVQKQGQKRAKVGANPSGGGNKSPSKQGVRSKRQSKQSAKALRRKKVKQKKRSLLLAIERQNERKKTKKVGVTAIFDDAPEPAPGKDSEHRHSVRRVQNRLRRIAISIQARAEYDEKNEFVLTDRENLQSRLTDFEDIRPLLSFDEDADIELVLGFDFGSTSSKIVCRFPYDEGLGAFAVPCIDSLSAEGHSYYWRTLLWEDETGNFRLTPGTAARLHEHLKLAFLRQENDGAEVVTTEMVYVSAYLVLMIKQSLGWLWQRVGRAIEGNSIGLSVNFGFPTEAGGQSPQLDRFQTCARVALRLAVSNGAVTRAQLESALKKELTGADKLLVRTLVVPEFIGAVIGYFHSAQKKNGQFMICDIGGLTIDAVCFGFYQAKNGDSFIKIYGGAVAPFGAEIAKIAVEDMIPKSRLATAIGSFVCGPIRDSYEKTGYNAPAWGGAMPLFVIGGGRHYDGYFGAFSEAERLIRNSWFKTAFQRHELDLNEELDITKANGRSCGRLMVAWGLSHSDLDLPEWLTRAELADGPKLSKFDIDSEFIGKEQT